MIIMEVFVMKILASCDIDKAASFNGKLILPNEDDKKPDKVTLNIVVGEGCEYSNEEIFKKVAELGDNIVECVTFKVEEGRFASYVPTGMEGRVFNEYSSEYYYNPNTPVCEKAVSLLRLPEWYSNMRNLYDVCREHPDVRFIGGHLLAVDGVRIGRFDTKKDKMSPVFKDIYDCFVEVDLNDLDGIQEIVKKTRRKAEKMFSDGSKRKPRVGKPKVKKVSKRVEAFNSLFAGDAEEEF